MNEAIAPASVMPSCEDLALRVLGVAEDEVGVDRV